MKKIDKNDTERIFQTIDGAALITGVSRYFIRSGCKNGIIPHIKCGAKYLINLPLFIEQLNGMSASEKQTG